ncbi:metal ABC transporter solute-binding protein, Zn/Mn family [Pseudobacteroides cellulosolvens]|uniref:ABC-type metal ion transporter, periplasmic subunit n=1 Tax=Pseudobacteroides cellulosolvens ATCC 35603 = DSM 2933 TaxID=398512 RepID=A0A0L6JVK2_9FIRM|nr:zinc ABC transporter substrate-binding protein [Pseudobacteroides cellulosolvens]KNY29462.1 ABC-type metal ion transporter, periplasmic subunit [Pseudobacteroides cellulosolvens ATCC 35603 = DSM 2933]
MKKIVFTVLLFVCIALSGCKEQSATQTESSKIQVAVSIVPQAEFVKAVGGDLVDVVTMIPSGKSTENYAPTPQEIEKFSNSSLYFAVGVPTEIANILPKARELNKHLKIIKLNDEVRKAYPEREFYPGSRDPHIWMSPKRVKVMVEIISNELSKIDSKNKSLYEKNAQEYCNKLDELNKQIKESLSNLKNKTFIVYHPALGYFADEYGLRMLSLEEEGKDATAKDFEQKISEAKKQGIKVIFYQAEIDSKQSKAFAEELNGSTEQISPLAPDYIENLRKTADTFVRVLNKQ